MKRYFTMLLVILGAMFVQAQPHDPSFQLYITKVELSGEVKLVWNKPSGMGGMVQYELYRAMVSDSASFKLITTTGDYSYIDKIPTAITNFTNSYAYYLLAKSGAVTVKSNVQIVPVTGIPIIGSFRLEGKIEEGKVKLFWQKPPVNNVSYYLVHGGHAAIAAPLLPVIDSTTNEWSITDAPVFANPGMFPVPFVYYVVAKLTNGEILVSTTIQLTFHNKPNRDDVKFISVPPLMGQENRRYEYKAQAISTDPNAVIRYFGGISQGMMTVVVPGFSIDSISGVVNWIPQSKGYYNVQIIARSNKGGEARQSFMLSVSGGNGIIQGRVTDTLNVPIPNVLVEVFKTENTSNTSFASFAYAAKTDGNGKYQINRVDPGKYKLKANSPSGMFQSQWYDGKREPALANVITVQDSPSVTNADFTLRGGASNLPKLTVTGTVKDTLGLSINGENSRVIFVRAEFALNIGSGLNINAENFRRYFEFHPHGDFRLEGNSEFVSKATVDSLGNFTVKLHPGAYIAFARAKGYSTEFYNEKPDLLSANVIQIQNNVSGINFTLAPLPPVVLGEIIGAVLDSVKDIPVPARILAFRDGWRINDNHKIARVYVTDNDSTGAYKFSELLPGTYVVMAVPLGNYAPAFYSTDTMSVRWKRATRIVINGNSVDDITIYVRPLGPSANGYTNIAGNVNISGVSSTGSGKAGAVVYAYRNNEISGYALTEGNGNYSINGLVPGRYSVFVDKPGFNESSVISVDVAYDNSGAPLSGTANFTINSTTSVTYDRSVTPTEYALEQNYPNPFNPSTSIRYSLPVSGNVTLKVFNILGKEVATLVNGYQQSGKYTVTFNASNLASGIYFYRLENGTTKEVKKMVLMK